jgi:hypothetical protein
MNSTRDSKATPWVPHRPSGRLLVHRPVLRTVRSRSEGGGGRKVLERWWVTATQAAEHTHLGPRHGPAVQRTAPWGEAMHRRVLAPLEHRQRWRVRQCQTEGGDNHGSRRQQNKQHLEQRAAAATPPPPPAKNPAWLLSANEAQRMNPEKGPAHPGVLLGLYLRAGPGNRGRGARGTEAVLSAAPGGGGTLNSSPTWPHRYVEPSLYDRHMVVTSSSALSLYFGLLTLGGTTWSGGKNTSGYSTRLRGVRDVVISEARKTSRPGGRGGRGG